MAKPELGTKRVDPETGQKFYDLNKDPVVSPYTGKTYPRTYFESAGDKLVEEEVEEKEEIESDDSAPEVISLEEADEDTKSGDDAVDIEDEEDVDLGDEDDDDTFLADDEEEDDDVADIIGVGEDDDES